MIVYEFLAGDNSINYGFMVILTYTVTLQHCGAGSEFFPSLIYANLKPLQKVLTLKYFLSSC